MKKFAKMEKNIKTKKNLQSLILLIPLIGFIGICLMMLKIKEVLQVNISNLPLDMSLLPPQWLFWIFVAMIAIPFTIFPLNKKIRIASLIITLIFINSGFVLFSPYGYPYGIDSQYAYQTAKTIQDVGYWQNGVGTGGAVAYSDYPGMYLFHTLTSFLTNLPLITSFMFMQSLLRFILMPLLIYLMFRKFFDFNISILCVFLYFSCFTIINWPHHENFAIIFFFLFLYSYLLNIEKPTALIKIMVYSSALFVFMSHHFTSYLLLGWSFLFPFSFLIWDFFVKNKISQDKIKINFKFKNALTTFFMILFLFVSWNYNFTLQKDIEQSKSFLSIFHESIKTDFENIATESIYEDSGSGIKEIEGENEKELESKYQLPSVNEDTASQKKFDIKNFINHKYQQIKNFESVIPGANFTNYQIIIILLSFIILFFFLIYGFLNLKKIMVNVFLLNNLFFSILIVSISSALLFTDLNYVPLRIFEFAYIGIIPLIAYSITSINIKYKLVRFMMPISLVIILLGGLMSTRLTTIRNFYVPQDNVLVYNDFFASPSFIESAFWFKDNLIYQNLLGDTLIYDTVGAFGNSNVRVYNKDLLQEFLNVTPVPEKTYEKARARNIDLVATHKYSKYSQYKGDKNKLEEENGLDMIYNNKSVQFFKINKK